MPAQGRRGRKATAHGLVRSTELLLARVDERLASEPSNLGLLDRRNTLANTILRALARVEELTPRPRRL
jgi:hypothetical protein